MRLGISTAILVCAIVLHVAVGARNKRIPERDVRTMRREMRKRGVGYNTGYYPTIENFTKAPIDGEFLNDRELVAIYKTYPQNDDDAVVVPNAPVAEQQITLVVANIRSARRVQCGPYIFVNAILGSPDEICGALGYVSAGGIKLEGGNATCAAKCGYTFHKRKFGVFDDSDSSSSPGSNSDSGSDSDSSSDPHSDSHSSNSSRKKCSNDCESSIEPIEECGGVWKHQCRRVTLCKMIECTCCLAPTYLNFEDVCPNVGMTTTPTPTFQWFLYNGFLLYGGKVINAEPACNGDGQSGFSSAIISPMNVLQISGSIPFVLSRDSPFTLKCIFVTYTPDRASGAEPENAITVEIIGKQLRSERAFYYLLPLFRDLPRAFAPKEGFNNITSLTVKTQNNATHKICIDSITLCA